LNAPLPGHFRKLGISGTVRPYSSLKAYLGEISTDEGIKGLGLFEPTWGQV